MILAATIGALAFPALAATYPVAGKWGAGAPPSKDPVDCSKLRVISFDGNQRTDTGGGVPAYRNRSVTPDGATQYRIIDVFSNGQISDGQSAYVLRKVDANHIELTQSAGTLKLQRCK